MIKLNNINCTEYTAKQVTLLTAFQIYLKSDQYVLQITFISLILQITFISLIENVWFFHSIVFLSTS